MKRESADIIINYVNSDHKDYGNPTQRPHIVAATTSKSPPAHEIDIQPKNSKF